MRKTLFHRYFTICSSIILISMTFLGFVLMMFASQYFKNDRYNMLSKSVTQLSQDAQSNMWMREYIHGEYLRIDADTLSYPFYLMGTAIDADIYLVNMEGRVLVCSHLGPCGHSATLISSSLLAQVPPQGEFREFGTMGGIYSSRYYTVGQPILERQNGEVVGVVFASAPSGALNTFLVDILQMFLISAVLVLLFSFIIIYFITYNMVRPLQEMLAATQSFAKGDFSARVPVEGDDEVGMLAEAFNTMAASLAAMESSRRSFTANVSHELKTPMTTIGGFIDGILDGTIPPERQRHYLGIVSVEVQRLSRLVRSMLSIARIEAGELCIVPTPVEMTDIVNRTVFSFEQIIEEKEIQVLGLDAEHHLVAADPDLLYQVVYNLVDNAIKFVNPGGTLEFGYQLEGGFLFVSVKNSGQGIAPDEIPKLFDRFYKSDKSRSLDKNGVGLGLSIVKTIVNLHGGEIYIKSQPGEFTQFVFSLPAVPPKKTGIFRGRDRGEKGDTLPEPPAQG